MNGKIYMPRSINYEGRGLVTKCTIDSELTVVDKNGKEIPYVVHNGQKYVPCEIGDTIIAYYSKKKYSRNFKVVGIDHSEQFFVCELILSFEDNIEMQLIDLKTQAENGIITTNQAHLKADDLIISLLYNKGLDRIADAFTRVPKYYE